MATGDLAAEFAGLLSAGRVLTGAAAEQYQVDGGRPELALLPESIGEVSGILRRADDLGLAVIPWGAGTLIDLGNRPSRYRVALDLTHLDEIVEYSPEDLVVTVQAGARVAALNAELGRRGQFLALDPPRADLATVGGTLSAGLAGPIRQRYGGARDLVIGLTCVLAGGEVVHSGGRVVKNVAGYDLNKLYLGAIGTLGVIVEASFKLHPLPAAREALAARFASCSDAHAAALGVINSHFSPAAVELAGPTATRDLLGGAEGGWLLAILLSGLPAAVQRQQREIADISRGSGAREITDLGPDEGGGLFQRLRDFGRGPSEPAALILRCAVRPSEIAATVARLEPLTAPSAPAVLASPGAGLVRLFWGELPDSAETLVRSLRSEVEGMSGTVSIERCPPELKDNLEVWGIAGPDLTLMRDLKSAFDPRGTLSPGRFVDRL